MWDSGPQSQREEVLSGLQLLPPRSQHSFFELVDGYSGSVLKKVINQKAFCSKLSKDRRKCLDSSSYQQPNSPKSRNSRLGGGISRLGLLSDLH